MHIFLYSLECICCLCESVCAVFLQRLLELLRALKFAAAAGASAPRCAKTGVWRAANIFLARHTLGGCWRCSKRSKIEICVAALFFELLWVTIIIEDYFGRGII